jgi:biotin synthase-like enzyme
MNFKIGYHNLETQASVSIASTKTLLDCLYCHQAKYTVQSKQDQQKLEKQNPLKHPGTKDL